MREIKQFDEKEYKKKIIPIIKEKNGTVTPADIALKTGFPIIHIKYVLNKLAAQYLAEIIPTEDGGLLYKFTNQLKEIGKYSKMAKKVLSFLLNILTFLFKIVIMLTLIGYMIFYIIAITAIIIGLTVKGDSDSDSDFGIDFVFGIIRVFFELIVNSIFFFSIDPYEKYQDNSKKRPFYIRVFSFVFGDDKKEVPFDHDNNIFKYLKSSKQVTLAQAINLTGLSEAETRKILINMVVKYNGDIEVNDDGVIIYTFSELKLTGDDNKKTSYAWNREKLIPQLNYNKKGENMWIIGFNLFNIIMGGVLIYLSEYTLSMMLNSMNTGIFFLYIYPFVFSSLFFIIPIARFFRLKVTAPRVELYNRFLRTLKIIFKAKDNSDYLESSQVEEDIREKIFIDYPSIFVHDFMDDKDVINIVGYKEGMIKSLE